MPNTSGPLVVALFYDGLCTFEFGIVAEVFGLARPEMGESWYRFASCAVEDGPLRAHGGFLPTPEHGLDLVDPADFVVVPGWKGAGRRSSSSALFPHATNRRSPRSSTGCGPTSAHPGRWRAWHRSAA